MKQDLINYSQCWEDTEILKKALNIKQDDNILSVTSGGDNTLSLLLCNPRQIKAIDLNPAQNQLLQLKLAAAKGLNYEEYLSFLGVSSAFNRLDLFSKLKKHLTPASKTWWSQHSEIIEKGIINYGRFEKYLNLFRKYVLPLAHSGKTVARFLAITSLDKQREFYKTQWNTIWWRLYFRLATSRSVLKNLARQNGMFKYVDIKRTSDEYLKRLESNLKNIPILNNYYLHYCLTGSFGKSLPDYLQEKSYQSLHNHKLSSLTIITNDIFTYLKSVPDNYFSKFNLSDIFEALSLPESLNLWEEVIRTAKTDATVVYWDNLLSRPISTRFADQVKVEKQLQEKLAHEDRLFFYGGLHIYRIIK